MPDLGFTLSAEEHPPRDLVRTARVAEDAGFDFLTISDHFHPWTGRQGQSAFVWAVLGAVAHETEQVGLMTAVTCPTIRMHPAIVAQAAATVAAMAPGRFTLGVGTGERLNEHVVGARWPSFGERREQLEEAVQVMRELWTGGLVEHRGRHYTIDRARLYTLPDRPPDVAVAAGGPEAAQLAGRIGDGLVSTSPDRALVEAFVAAGGSRKPVYGQLTVCWAESEEEAVRTAHEWWPNAALGGSLGQELALPEDYEAAAATVRPGDVAAKVVCGPDPERYAGAVADFERAGFDHVFVHQVGPDQEGFLGFFERELSGLPHAA